MSAPVGSIEFLVKFDTMSTSFRNALEDALKKVIPSVQAAQTGPFPATSPMNKLKDWIAEIRDKIRRIWTPLSKHDPYARAAEKAMQNMEWFQDKTNMENLVTSVFASPAVRRLLHAPTIEKLRERMEDIKNAITADFQKIIESPGAWESKKAMLGQVSALIPAVEGGENIANYMKTIIKYFLTEPGIVSRWVTEMAETLSISFSASAEAAENLIYAVEEKEKYLYLTKREVGGENKELIEDTQEFMAAISSLAQAGGLSSAALARAYVEKATGAELGLLGEVIDAFFEQFRLGINVGIPAQLRKIIQKKIEDEPSLVTEEGDVFFTRRAKFAEQFPTQAALGERIRTAFDVQLFFANIGQVQEFIEKVNEITPDEWTGLNRLIEMMQKYDIEEYGGIGFIESKTLEAKFKGEVAESTAMMSLYGTTMGGVVASLIGKFPEEQQPLSKVDITKLEERFKEDWVKLLMQTFIANGVDANTISEEVVKKMLEELGQNPTKTQNE